MTNQREYSDDTARVIDEEIEKILREQEDRARDLLGKHRRGLDLVAQALVEKETIEGAEVIRLVQDGLAEADGSGNADGVVADAHPERPAHSPPTDLSRRAAAGWRRAKRTPWSSRHEAKRPNLCSCGAGILGRTAELAHALHRERRPPAAVGVSNRP